MAEGSGVNNTPIWVALITVTGALLTAVIANADKWLDREEKSAAAAPSTATASTEVAPTSGLAPSGAASGDTGVAAPPASPTPAPVATAIDLAGQWRDDEGAYYSFEQTGARFELTQTATNGNFLLLGKGTISGRELSYTFEEMTGETGSCSGYVNSAGDKINGNCLWSEAGGGWTYTLER